MTIDQTEQRGSFTRDQVQQLLRGINPKRVVTGAHVQPHLSQQDVLAHLTRVLGFGHFDVEVLHAELLFEEPMTNSNNKAAWSVGYRALVRLYVRDEQQRLVAFFDGGSTGESEGQPSRAASHDLAYKSALSTSTKRAAIALGDQFGLSLYNRGQIEPLVKGTLVGITYEGGDVQADVDQQQVDGGREAERDDAEVAEQPATPTKPTTGTQGTKRASRAKAKPQPEGPVNPPDVQAETPEQSEPIPVQAGEPITEGPMTGLTPTPEQVAATQHVEQARESGVNVEVADAITAAPIPEVGPQGDDPREPEPVADERTGEVSTEDTPDQFVDRLLQEAGRDANGPIYANVVAALYQRGRTDADAQALWRFAEREGDLTTELRVSIINARKIINGRQNAQPQDTASVLDGTL